MSSVILFSDAFCFFLLVAILFFVIIHFSMIIFLLVIFVIVVLYFLFPGYFPKLFLDMSRFVAVIIFFYVCTFFMPAVFSFVPIFPASREGTFVLGFYVKGSFILSCGF